MQHQGISGGCNITYYGHSVIREGFREKNAAYWTRQDAMVFFLEVIFCFLIFSCDEQLKK